MCLSLLSLLLHFLFLICFQSYLLEFDSGLLGHTLLLLLCLGVVPELVPRTPDQFPSLIVLVVLVLLILS